MERIYHKIIIFGGLITSRSDGLATIIKETTIYYYQNLMLD